MRVRTIHCELAEKIGQGGTQGPRLVPNPQTDIHPLLLHVINHSGKKISVFPSGVLWNGILSTCLEHATHTHQYSNTLKALVQLGAFLSSLHLNGTALFPSLIIMKAFHYAGSYMPNKQLGIRSCKCKLKCVFKACVRGDKVICATRAHSHCRRSLLLDIS